MKLILPAERVFGLGTVFVTANAAQTLSEMAISTALFRHATCDWGEVCPEDWRTNDYALAHGHRLFSLYTDGNGKPFYVITEWDRSVTTVLMPEDY